MSKDRTARVLTIAFIGAAGAFLLWKNAGGGVSAVSLPEIRIPQRAPEPSPQDAIYSMLDAARDGDLDKYLDCFGSQMQANLRQAVREMGREGFLDSIRKANAEIKGVAVMEPEKVSESEVRAKVEYVYQDRNEVQTLYLERDEGRWKIGRLDSAERIKTLIPYGTPVQ